LDWLVTPLGNAYKPTLLGLIPTKKILYVTYLEL
jgi:hypothetical protein